MTGRRHPYENVELERLADGTVRVRDLDSGLEGIFRGNGSWCSGDLTYADPQMTRWVADTGPDATPQGT